MYSLDLQVFIIFKMETALSECNSNVQYIAEYTYIGEEKKILGGTVFVEIKATHIPL